MNVDEFLKMLKSALEHLDKTMHDPDEWHKPIILPMDLDGTLPYNVMPFASTAKVKIRPSPRKAYLDGYAQAVKAINDPVLMEAKIKQCLMEYKLWSPTQRGL